MGSGSSLGVDGWKFLEAEIKISIRKVGGKIVMKVDWALCIFP